MSKKKCCVVVDKGHQMIMMPNGEFLPFQLGSIVQDKVDEQPTATVTLEVCIFSTREEALKFYDDIT